MSKVIRILLLLTTIMYNSNTNSTMLYNPLYDIKKTILDNCSVETTGDDYGKLSYNGKLLIDKNNYYYYDLKTMLEQNAIRYDQDLPNFGGGNLIIKELNYGSTDTYRMSISNYSQSITSGIADTSPLKIILPSNTTLIIPQGITFAKDRVLLRAIEKENITIVNLGTMISDQYDAHINIMKSKNILVIIGPESRFPQLIGNYPSNNNGKYPISLWNNNGKDNKNTNVKYILYPGCKLNYNNDPIIANNEKCTISQYGRVYLNRFLPSKDERKELYGRISNEIHITYPNIKDEDEFNTTTVEGSGNYKTHTINTFFPKIYWVGDVNSHSEGTDNDTKTEYDYKEQEEPLYFNGNGVLDLKPKEENELAVYDAKLWNECGLNEGKYSLSHYNTPENKDKYIDVDKAHEIFYGVDYDDDPIEIDTDTLNIGLIGDKDVQLNTDSDTVNLLGDNSNFDGNLILPNGVTGINYGDSNSEIPSDQIKRLDENGEIDDEFNPSSLTITYSNNNPNNNPNNNQNSNSNDNSNDNPNSNSNDNQNNNPNNNPNNNSSNNNTNHKPNNNGHNNHNHGYTEINNGKDKIISWDLALLGNVLYINPDNYRKAENIIITLTNSNRCKYNFDKLIVKGNNKWVKGIIIITTPEIEEVEFWKWSFINTINISGKALKYIFKDTNLFKPFIPYNRILADRADYININNQININNYLECNGKYSNNCTCKKCTTNKKSGGNETNRHHTIKYPEPKLSIEMKSCNCHHNNKHY